MIYSLVISLLLTLLVEVTVSLILGIRSKEDIQVVIWTNILTNPIIVFLANCIVLLKNNLIYYVSVIIMEIIVVIVEFIIYKKYLNYKKKSPLIISIINNVISFSLGLIIEYLF